MHVWFKRLKTKKNAIEIAQEKLKKFIKNLKNFRYDYKLQEAALAFIVHNSLHLDQMKETYKVFKRLDENNDGIIAKEELINFLEKFYGIPNLKQEVDEIFSYVDSDNNGYIEYEEFVRAAIDKEKLLTKDVMHCVFNFFDKDGNGEISYQEFKEIFCRDVNSTVSEKLLKEMMEEVDLDGNLNISFNEFCKMMTKIITKET